VDPPDRRQVWEAPSHTRSVRTFTTTPAPPQLGIPLPGVSRRNFRKVGKPIKSIGWLVSYKHVGEAYRFTGIYK